MVGGKLHSRLLLQFIIFDILNEKYTMFGCNGFCRIFNRSACLFLFGWQQDTAIRKKTFKVKSHALQIIAIKFFCKMFGLERHDFESSMLQINLGMARS